MGSAAPHLTEMHNLMYIRPSELLELQWIIGAHSRILTTNLTISRSMQIRGANHCATFPPLLTAPPPHHIDILRANCDFQRIITQARNNIFDVVLNIFHNSIGSFRYKINSTCFWDLRTPLIDCIVDRIIMFGDRDSSIF